MTLYDIAQAISILVALISIVVLQLKSMKGLLIGNLTINALAALAYLLQKGYSAAAIGIIAVVQCIVMYFYNRQNKRPSIPVVLLFIALFISCSAVYYQSLIDILPASAAVLFAISMACKRPLVSRSWIVFNTLTWMVYDILLGAWGGLIMHSVILTSVLVALVRVDGIFKLIFPKKESNPSKFT